MINQLVRTFIGQQYFKIVIEILCSVIFKTLSCNRAVNNT